MPPQAEPWAAAVISHRLAPGIDGTSGEGVANVGDRHKLAAKVGKLLDPMRGGESGVTMAQDCPAPPQSELT